MDRWYQVWLAGSVIADVLIAASMVYFVRLYVLEELIPILKQRPTVDLSQQKVHVE